MNMPTFDERRWVAVRCCCQPLKILGFMPVPVERLRPGVEMYVRNRDGVARITLRQMSQTTQSESSCVITNEVAIYSEDRPIEFWRDVEGFVEVGS